MNIERQLGPEEQPNIEILKWEEEWRQYYAPLQKKQIDRELKKYGVEISESEWKHYFDAVNFVGQEDFTRAIESFGNTEEESKKNSNNEWGVEHRGVIYINPVKQDGRKIEIASPLVMHEVLHSAADFFDEKQNFIRNGLFSSENSRELGEAVIDELCHDALSDIGDIPPNRHDFMNQLCQVLPFKDWVLGCFTEQGYRDLRKKIEAKLGDRGFEAIALFAKYNMSFEFGEYIRTGEIKLPRYADEDLRDKFLALGKSRE